MIAARSWAPDPTRRFSRRPIYLTEDIEAMLGDLRKERHVGTDAISDDALESLIEALTAEYDAACDLRYIAEDVEGATKFSFDDLPAVMIDRRLSEPAMRRRRRMTIAHELGHVMLHAPLFARNARADLRLFSDTQGSGPVYCFRDAIECGSDWMEWQASFAAAALLVPSSAVHRLLEAEVARARPLHLDDPASGRLVRVVSEHFAISNEAAEVRLLQLRYLDPDRHTLTLPFSE